MKLIIETTKPGSYINPDIYGHFSEHLGRGIYEGLYVGEDSPIPNTDGIRNDVLEALKFRCRFCVGPEDALQMNIIGWMVSDRKTSVRN